ncbi:Cytochrome c family protein [Streptomyces sp. KY75]|nr:Cytochrome c family protein [Streptomyces sp. KY70]CAD5979218.1 Cytochrome c family protein [Streptomyces sp. KY75]
MAAIPARESTRVMSRSKPTVRGAVCGAGRGLEAVEAMGTIVPTRPAGPSGPPTGVLGETPAT